MKIKTLITCMLVFGGVFSSVVYPAPVTETSLLRTCGAGHKAHPFVAFNHYCYGVKRLGEAAKLYDNPGKRNFILREAVDDFEYVIGHIPLNEKNRQHAPVIAFTSIHKARALVMLKRYNEAIDAYGFAIHADPMQAKGYVGLSDVYKRQGMKNLALEVIENGLKRLPSSKSLLRRKKRLKKLK